MGLRHLLAMFMSNTGSHWIIFNAIVRIIIATFSIWFDYVSTVPVNTIVSTKLYATSARKVLSDGHVVIITWNDLLGNMQLWADWCQENATCLSTLQNSSKPFSSPLKCCMDTMDLPGNVSLVLGFWGAETLLPFGTIRLQSHSSWILSKTSSITIFAKQLALYCLWFFIKWSFLPHSLSVFH